MNRKNATAAIVQRVVTFVMISLVCMSLMIAAAAQEAATQSATEAPAEAPKDQGWPRVFEKDGKRVVIHQPQVDQWENYSRTKFRCAIAVTPAKDAEPRFGVLEVHAATKVDKEAQTVLLSDAESEIRFPNVADNEAAGLEAIAREVVPKRTSMVVSLQRVMAYMEQSPAVQKDVQVNLDPPPIFHSDKPAELIVFVGKPRFKAIDKTSGGLLFAINTNWDVILDSATSTYYVLNNGTWFKTTDLLKGTLTGTATLPDDFKHIPADANWEDVRAAVPPNKPGQPVRFFVSTEPAEIIVTNGPPEYTPIEGTPLMYVANTDVPLFLHGPTHTHYFLVAGRWFSAEKLGGPWKAATHALPDNFARIPHDSPVAYVLSSVPGTDAASDAVLLASVPHKATVDRKTATVSVVYDGDPKFVPIEGTEVRYAVNTVSDVLLVSNQYYCCSQGVWFAAVKPAGPWVVCTQVPSQIYTIPPSSPKHNVTYVYVYESTPDTVVVGSTSGYNGELVAGGLLLFGAGMLVGAALADDDDDDWYGCYHYHSCFYSYGCGAIYSPVHCGYYRQARYCGPYGGAGAVAAYNPATGGWARGAYRYGPNGAAGARAGYNPWTDTYAARAGAVTPYGSWSRGVVVRDDEWVRGGTASNWRGSAGWVQSSSGAGAAHIDGRRGSGTAVRDDDGNVYVGNDGEIYRRNDNGNWQKRDGDDWNSVDVPEREGRSSAGNTPDRTKSAPKPQTNAAGRSREDLSQDLNKQARSRETGNKRTRDSQRVRSSPTRSSPGRSRGRR